MKSEQLASSASVIRVTPSFGGALIFRLGGSIQSYVDLARNGVFYQNIQTTDNAVNDYVIGVWYRN